LEANLSLHLVLDLGPLYSGDSDLCFPPFGQETCRLSLADLGLLYLVLDVVRIQDGGCAKVKTGVIWPNQAAAVNGAMTPLFQFGGAWRAVPEQRR
jgi:hypothetical protein